MKKSPISVRIIYVLSVIVFYLLIVATSVTFVANLLLEIEGVGDDFQLRIQLPVTFNVNETGTTQIYDKPNPVRIEEATGKLYIIDTPVQFTKLMLRFLFPVVALGLFMAWKFKLFITSIKKGVVFEFNNINNLKHISYALLILFVLTKVYEQVLYQTTVKYLNFNSIHIDNGVADRSDMLIVAMLLWVLAHVFMKGQELQEEHDQTI